jgi:multidrug efflux system outer membrane protein
MFNSITRMALAASMVALAAGCATVGKDFSAPQGVAATGYRHQDPAKADQARLPSQWWTVFGDDTLNKLEQQAMRDNPSIKASAQRLLQAQAQLGTLRAAQSPNVAVGTSIANSRSSQNTSQSIMLGRRTIEGNNTTLGVSMSYELDVWGRVARVVEAADAQALAAQDDRDGVALLLSTQLATTYWQLRGMDAELAILGDALATRRETEQLVTARFDAGLSNELDVSRARIERANAEADLHEVQRQRNTLEHALSTLVGVTPSTPMIATRQGAAGSKDGVGGGVATKDGINGGAGLPQPPSIPVGLPASLLAQRPDLAASVALLRAANAQIGVAEGAFYPSLSLTGSFGYASESLRDLAQGSSRQFSVGPLALSLPLFDGGRNKANLAMAKARYDEAVANHEGKLLTALREVEDALSDVQQRALQGQVQAQSQQAAKRALEVARARYERGVSTYLDVTDAQRSALAADRAAAQITTQRLLAAVAVARSLGAGWQQEPALASVR